MTKVLQEKNNNLKALSKFFTPTRLIVFGFIFIIILGAFLLSLPISNNDRHFFNFGDALFTAVSATCVTGLIVVDTATQFNLFGQIIILLLIQIGGLGFMTITTLIFILMGKRITLRERLVIQESLSQFNLQGLVKMTKKVIKMTLIIESIGAVLLTIGFCFKVSFWKALYFGIFHSISSFCNAGFDVLGKDFTPYSGMINCKHN
jgi:trk system potassium uptake protein TrkH